MKTSEVLRKAAKLMEDWHEGHSCLAICMAMDCPGYEYNTNPVVHKFCRIMLDRVDLDALLSGFSNPYDGDNQNHRIVALCLAAAISESEGD